MPAGQTWQRQFQGGTRYSRAFLNVCLKREPLKTPISSKHPSGNSPLLGLAAAALEQQPHALVVTVECCAIEGRPALAARGTKPRERKLLKPRPGQAGPKAGGPAQIPNQQLWELPKKVYCNRSRFGFCWPPPASPFNMFLFSQ